MAALEQVMRMKNQGIPEGEIINQLSQQGFSPKDITDALRQAQIKSAVSSDYDNMQPSVMMSDEVPSPNQDTTYQAAPQYEPQQYTQQPEEYQPQEAQQQYYSPGMETGGYAPQAGIDTDTVMEIADQVFSDKIKKIQKQVEATSDAAISLQSKFENVSERLKKIELTIDKLQIAILEKVGSYGQNLEGIKKEMSMMQDSFSKMVSPYKERRTQQQEGYVGQQETRKQISRKK
ncbi:Uncharacterised protein [uncultured archaeon]|nr:Uncharacterised protein [uncultured archaeon]